MAYNPALHGEVQSRPPSGNSCVQSRVDCEDLVDSHQVLAGLIKADNFHEKVRIAIGEGLPDSGISWTSIISSQGSIQVPSQAVALTGKIITTQSQVHVWAE